MEDLQNFQDCTNENIERLKEKLEELNLNNKVSFDEYTEEKPIKQRKKTKKKLNVQKMKKLENRYKNLKTTYTETNWSIWEGKAKNERKCSKKKRR